MLRVNRAYISLFSPFTHSARGVVVRTRDKTHMSPEPLWQSMTWHSAWLHDPHCRVHMPVYRAHVLFSHWLSDPHITMLCLCSIVQHDSLKYSQWWKCQGEWNKVNSFAKPRIYFWGTIITLSCHSCATHPFMEKESQMCSIVHTFEQNIKNLFRFRNHIFNTIMIYSTCLLSSSMYAGVPTTWKQSIPRTPFQRRKDVKRSSNYLRTHLAYGFTDSMEIKRWCSQTVQSYASWGLVVSSVPGEGACQSNSCCPGCHCLWSRSRRTHDDGC